MASLLFARRTISITTRCVAVLPPNFGTKLCASCLTPRGVATMAPKYKFALIQLQPVVSSGWLYFFLLFTRARAHMNMSIEGKMLVGMRSGRASMRHKWLLSRKMSGTETRQTSCDRKRVDSPFWHTFRSHHMLFTGFPALFRMPSLNLSLKCPHVTRIYIHINTRSYRGLSLI